MRLRTTVGIVLLLSCLLSGCSCTPNNKPTENKNQSEKKPISKNDSRDNFKGKDKAANEKSTSSDSSSSENAVGGKSSSTSDNAGPSNSSSDGSKGSGGKDGGKPAQGGLSGKSGNGQPGTNRHSLSPQVALKKAKTLKEESQRDERAGKTGGAYTKAAEAYEILRPHRSDADCQALESELLSLLERLAREANGKSGSPNYELPGKPVVIE